MSGPEKDAASLNEVGDAVRRAGLAAGPICAVSLLVLWRPSVATGDPLAVAATAAVAVLMAIWWMTEALPFAVTSLLPMALLPLLVGAPLDLPRVAANYSNWQVFLFFGGFLIAIAMEESGLHRRIALVTVRAIGTRPRRIVLGFMVAAALLSMWISNTATALMMLPIGRAVIRQLPDRPRFAEALMLGTAYAASIGGVATPIGTPPNIAFMGIYQRLFPGEPPIGFASWMAFAVPLVAVMLPLTWLWLVAGLRREAGDAAPLLEGELARLGPMGRAERRVLAIFLATAALWVFRQDIPLGDLRLPGWSGLLPGAAINDGVVAMTMGLLLFVVPGDRGRALLRWASVERRMPWGILLLFGGGFALADAIGASGLSAWVGGGFGFLTGMPALVLIAATATLLTFTTELTSNTATAQIMLPLAAAAAGSVPGMHPLVMMLPVTVAASFAFMLPVATPPNAVVFGSGAVSMRGMVRNGFALNLLGIVLLTLACRFLAPLVFGYRL